MKLQIRPDFTIFIFLFILVLYGSVYSQTGSIRGFVYEKETGEPVIFTNVYLFKTSFGAATDVNGYFAITKIPPGTYKLMITYLGYDTLSMDVDVKANDVITKKLFLIKGSYTLEAFKVEAEREEMRTETRTSVVKITPKQIEKIPTIGGTPDFAQYLQVLPGVIFTGDQGGQLYIRGGSPVQNKVLLDGMIVYNPFHSIGLFSVFETDILRNADVYTGGFGAEYGGRISSVMDITTRDGNKTRYAGKIEGSTFGSNVLLEGPLQKLKDGSLGSSSFILSAKTSYLEQSSKTFYKYVEEDGLPFNYTDLYGKLSFNSTNGSKINLYGFNFSDAVNNYRALSDFHWNSFGGGSNFLVIPGKSQVLMEGHFAYSKYEITLEEALNPPRTSLINGFNMGFDFTYFLGKDEIKYGIEMLGFKTDYRFYNSLGVEYNQKQNTTELAAYTKLKKNWGKLIFEPGLRFNWYASLSELAIEPRLAAKYNVSDYFRLKFAAGLFSQNLISASSDRDVVNLFYGFLSGPDNLPEYFQDESINSKLQKSQHAILGAEVDLSQFVTLNIEGYYKNFSQLTNINRQKIYDENDFPDEPDLLNKDFIVETGDAEGIDLTLKYDNKRLYFWAVYSFAFIHRNYEDLQGDLRTYYPHFDRRHNVNLVSSYNWGEQSTWEVSARWSLGSGFPFTLTQGYYPLVLFNGGIYTDYTKVNEELGILYDDLNTGRLSYYHRLDFNLKKKFILGKNSKLEANVSATNIYNRKNIFYKDRVTNEEVNQLPFMPSFGLIFSF